VGAVDDCWLDALDTFDKLVKVCVIGKGDRVIDAQPPAPGGVDGPAGDADGDGAAQAVKAGRLLAARGRNDGRVGGWRAVAQLKWSKIAAAALVDEADGMDERMLDDANSGESKDAGHFLGFAEDVGVDDGRAPVVECAGDDRDELGNGFITRWQAIARLAVSALHDEHMGAGRDRGLGSCRLAELEIARVEERPFAGAGREHGGAEDVASRMGRERAIGPSERLAKWHEVRRARAVAVLIELGGGGSTVGQLVAGHVVGVRVRDESARLSPSDIDGEVDLGDSEAPIEMEHMTVSQPFITNGDNRH